MREDFNLAKQLAYETFDESSTKKEPSQAIATTIIDHPCSSSTANYLESIDLPNDNHSIVGGTKNELDDRKIAELLQSEFDLEYDEEVKRLENARNKSE